MTVTAPLGHTSCGRTGRPGARPVRGRFGAWRALAALPAIFGGTAVMFVLTAAWAPLLFVLWLGCAGLWSTPLGERLAVRTALGFRPLPPGRRDLIEGVCADGAGSLRAAGRFGRLVHQGRPAAQCVRDGAAQCGGD